MKSPLAALLAAGALCACTGASPGQNDATTASDVASDSDATAPDDSAPPADAAADGTAPPDAPADGPARDVTLIPAAAIVFQCAGLAGGICIMDTDGAHRTMLRADGRSPDRNAAGAILFHDDSYVVHRTDPDGTDRTLGAGAFARWAPDGTIVFQCAGLEGGICDMHADGGARRVLAATGRVPDRNAAGDVVYHDDSYVVHVRTVGGIISALGDGANAEWTTSGNVLFQCAGLAGGLCEMNADGSGRMTIRPSGRSPDRRGAGGLLYHDDAYTLHRIAPDGTESALGDGAFGRWNR
jgi:hypothetical protein